MNVPTPKDSHYARLRRNFRAQKQANLSKNFPEKRVLLYGYHTVLAAMKNPSRQKYKLWLTKNAAQKLQSELKNLNFPYEIVETKRITNLLGSDSVHQGVLLETEPRKARKIENLTNEELILVLDQITDPHNVGAIIRSAVAFKVDAIITVARHSPQETAILAKSASGALDFIEHIVVKNLAEALVILKQKGFQTIGLDSQSDTILEQTFQKKKLALVLGAEGKGLRQKTRQTVDIMAKLDVPGEIVSLNVSNAAAIALYSTNKFLRNL